MNIKEIVLKIKELEERIQILEFEKFQEKYKKETYQTELLRIRQLLNEEFKNDKL